MRSRSQDVNTTAAPFAAAAETGPADPGLPTPRPAKPAPPDAQISFEQEVRARIALLGLRVVDCRADAAGEGAMVVYETTDDHDDPDPQAVYPAVVVYWVPPETLAEKARTDTMASRMLQNIGGHLLDLVHTALAYEKPGRRITPYFAGLYLVINPVKAAP
ncbi:hypothetical protein ACIGXI_34670 [Kitasatospora aureofaciens]|uniref:hypothetical protein n=1 Tax=Kitasatospora aureofaciens TaxID=1894 RepID=UPI0037C7F6B7